ncbi:type II toxin-antitoxin system HicA family toxin [Dehalococcoidia bacterium]|nr:type II toxin-antitoxin system HicA family toxin [Dehalococcoidia bacterium]
MTKRAKIPAMSTKKLVKLLEQAGASFDRRGKGDHVIYKREVSGKVLKAPVLWGKKELRPEYSLVVFKQLGLTGEEINQLLQ